MQRGVTQLTRVSLEGEQEVVPGLEDYTTLAQLACSPQGQVALIASSGTIPPRVICWDPATQTSRVARYSSPEREPATALSRPEAVSWRGEDGELVHGIFYPPASARYRGEGAAPAIVIIHGGPTTHRPMGWDSRDQLFATRGYAVLEVNYRGSTGYGRAYREALRGQWGVLDVADAVSAAKFLASRDDVDGDRVAILGGSAGGYTVLRALTAHPGVFAAGVSLYGIADLFALAASTHKFESHYNDSLLGPLPGAREIYAARSPIRHVDQLSDPLAVFQGADDEVVPPEQAELIVAALRERGIPHIYHLYEGEGHGWRKPETIRHFYEATLAWYIAIPTTLALLSPKLGKFNVTAKGGVIADSYFDLKIVLPHIILLALNVTGASLGVNAVELMPIGEFAGAISWGYNPSAPYAVESDYGGVEGFKHFVKTCHEKGIAVILDVVYNHFGPSDLDLWQFDGWRENDKGGIYFYNDWRSSTPWGDSRPDYGRAEVREYIRNNALMWLDDYHVDGLRIDMSFYIRAVDEGADIPEGWSLIQWINDDIQKKHPGAIVIAEDYASARDAVPSVQIDPAFKVIPVRALANQATRLFAETQVEVIGRHRRGVR